MGRIIEVKTVGGKKNIVVTYENDNGTISEFSEPYTPEKMDTYREILNPTTQAEQVQPKKEKTVVSKLIEEDALEDVSDFDIYEENFKRKADRVYKLIRAALILGATIKFFSVVYNDFANMPSPIIMNNTSIEKSVDDMDLDNVRSR
ncbi:MAG: hypothetical protein IJ565_00355 [Bacilli bacterium]|nr:hypothetical protein [Bacilli bacterium]